MQDHQTLRESLKRLWAHIAPRRRLQFQFLLVLMVIASFAEVVSIGAVLPFLGVLTAPERILESAYAAPVLELLEISTAEDLLLPITLLFGAAAIGAGAMRLLLLWATVRLSYATGADLSISIYRRTLYQPYAVHTSRNSSDVITGIAQKTNNVIVGVIVPVLTLLSSSVMLIAIMAALLSIDPVIAVSAFVGFGAIYAGFMKLTNRHLGADGQRIADESTRVIKVLQEGLGGIRDVLIDGVQETYCKEFQRADLTLRRAQGNHMFIGQSPRPAMEALGMLLIAGLAYFMAQQVDGLAKAIPVLGALALGAQRLLPVLQHGYSSWTQMRVYHASLIDALELLDQPLPEHALEKDTKPLTYNAKIEMQDLSFRYAEDAPWVLKNVNLNIEKGDRIGFIGETGSGKSTLLDIVMGLLEPSEGSLRVDGQTIDRGSHRAWQEHIAHVPQAIFLSDATIAQNIAFGVPPGDIDLGRVRQAAHRAQIGDVIESWQQGYDTEIGERGVRLSGGQRQRIGIARALYKQADVIIFDEATSALDNTTEQAVMEAIENLNDDLTVLIIAHRLTTLKDCSRIVDLGDGGIKRIGSYQEIISQAA